MKDVVTKVVPVLLLLAAVSLFSFMTRELARLEEEAAALRRENEALKSRGNP